MKNIFISPSACKIWNIKLIDLTIKMSIKIIERWFWYPTKCWFHEKTKLIGLKWLWCYFYCISSQEQCKITSSNETILTPGLPHLLPRRRIQISKFRCRTLCILYCALVRVLHSVIKFGQTIHPKVCVISLIQSRLTDKFQRRIDLK